MLKPLSAFAALLLFSAAAAFADPHATTPAPSADTHSQALPPVDTMSCDQMTAEMGAAGRQMQAHLDPQFGVEANAMQQDAQQKQREAMAQAAAPNPVCFIPFMAMACAAQQQHQAQQSTQEAAANQARMQAQMNRLDNSMAGLDQARLQAINNRYQQMNCQAQAQSGQSQSR